MWYTWTFYTNEKQNLLFTVLESNTLHTVGEEHAILTDWKIWKILTKTLKNFLIDNHYKTICVSVRMTCSSPTVYSSGSGEGRGGEGGNAIPSSAVFEDYLFWHFWHLTLNVYTFFVSRRSAVESFCFLDSNTTVTIVGFMENSLLRICEWESV